MRFGKISGRLDDRTGDVETNDIRDVFMMTGAVPNTGWLERCVVVDDKGFIKTRLATPLHVPAGAKLVVVAH